MSTFIVRGVRPEEYALLGTLLAADEAAWHLRSTQPDFRYEQQRVGVLDGQIVAAAQVRFHALRYGRCALRVSGISGMYTIPAARQQGFAAAVMQDALAYSVEHGAHLALLCADQTRYYERFGFSAVWPHYAVNFDSGEAAALKPLDGWHLRPAHLDDLPALAALYEAQWGGRVTFLRPPEVWLTRFAALAPPHTLHVISTHAQAPAGYLYSAHPQGVDTGTELAVGSLEAAVALLAFAGQAHLAAGVETVEWLLPPDDPLILYARDVLSFTQKARYNFGGGWMARVIDGVGLVRAVLPELLVQCRLLLPELHTRDLLLNIALDGVVIGINRQPESHCHIGLADFVRLLFGSLRPAGLALRSAQTGGSVSADALYLLEGLFPARIATLGYWDWF